MATAFPLMCEVKILLSTRYPIPSTAPATAESAGAVHSGCSGRTCAARALITFVYHQVARLQTQATERSGGSRRGAPGNTTYDCAASPMSSGPEESQGATVELSPQ